MKLVAQRVMQPATQHQAIHAFYYTHAPYEWDPNGWGGALPPHVPNGTLQASMVELRPLGQNMILSYLDVIAPDEIPTALILRAFADLYDVGQAPPFYVRFGDCVFASNMTHAFRLAWRQELIRLFDVALAMRTAALS